MVKDTDKHLVGSHILKAHRTVRGEHQLAEYVAQLSLGECGEILSAADMDLASLAARHPECRVLSDEKRTFEEVIRIWTLYVLSGVEDG
ncbi:MAG: hypothetical protein WA982_01805 [Rubrobacteraceae bacterium]